MDKFLSPISRIVFIVALFCAGLAVFERVSYALGYTLLRGTITGGRLLEISTVLIIFVIAMLLREIRDLLRTRSG
jgi:hypothetical protein